MATFDSEPKSIDDIQYIKTHKNLEFDIVQQKTKNKAEISEISNFLSTQIC